MLHILNFLLWKPEYRVLLRSLSEGYGLQPVRKPRKINGALAPEGNRLDDLDLCGALKMDSIIETHH